MLVDNSEYEFGTHGDIFHSSYCPTCDQTDDDRQRAEEHRRSVLLDYARGGLSPEARYALQVAEREILRLASLARKALTEALQAEMAEERENDVDAGAAP